VGVDDGVLVGVVFHYVELWHGTVFVPMQKNAAGSALRSERVIRIGGNVGESLFTPSSSPKFK
jgi:hypothetical protein